MSRRAAPPAMAIGRRMRAARAAGLPLLAFALTLLLSGLAVPVALSAPTSLDTSTAPVPAPAPVEPRVITNVHTDTVASLVVDGKYQLDSKADLGGEIGYRLDETQTVFHLDTTHAAVATPPFDFLSGYGATSYLAPQTQNPALIWPGFSTENDALVAASSNQQVALELVEATGPGRVEVYLVGAFGAPERLFSSTAKLRPWVMGMRQHTHANWHFERPGQYQLTFRGTTDIDGATVHDTATYSFVVGPDPAPNTAVDVAVAAGAPTAPEGDEASFTATVEPASARGSVEFVDETTGQLLGASAVESGRATLATAALLPGAHEISARFVPAHTGQFRTAVSDATATVEVAGEAASPSPSEPDHRAATDRLLAEHERDTAVRLADREVVAGGYLLASLGTDRAGQWVSTWLQGDYAEWQRWTQVDRAGWVAVRVPDDAGLDASHFLVVKDAEGGLIGWDAFGIGTAPDIVDPVQPAPNDDHGNASGDSGSKPGSGNGSGSNGNGTSGGSSGGANSGGGSGGESPKTPPASGAEAAANTCEPDVVLDRGHVDAFNVSAANGQAVLQLKEDVTGSHVVREPERVLISVPESAKRDGIPSGYPGSPSGYVLPLTQQSDLVWPGWDTNRTTQSGFSDVRITVHSVDGPGAIHLYSLETLGGAKPLLDGGSTRLPGTIHEPRPAHTHAQWVFSAPGIYTLTASATATNPSSGESLTTSTRSYVIRVGDVPLGDAFCKVGVSAADAAVGESVQADVAAAEQAAAAAAATPTPTPTGAALPGPTGAATHAADAAGSGSGPGGGSGFTAIGDAIAGLPPIALGALIGAGGMLAVSGIGLAVWWYLRWMRAMAAIAA